MSRAWAEASAEHRRLCALISAQRRTGRAVDPADAARVAELGRIITAPRETRHTHAVVFGRREEGCPRCAELEAGAAPRAGWGRSRRDHDARMCLEIRQHDCHAAGCGPVCTFGDW